MKELIYKPLRKILCESKPKWGITFENQTMKIITKETHLDNQILQKIRNLGFKVYEISYFDEFGSVFSSRRESLSKCQSNMN